MILQQFLVLIVVGWNKMFFYRDSIFPILDKKFVKAKLYTDTGVHAQENLQLQIEKFQTIALPFYAIISPENKILATWTGSSLKISDFEKFLLKNIPF